MCEPEQKGHRVLGATFTVSEIREMSPHVREDRKAMLDTDDLALWYALNRLMTNYWADVDHNGGGHAH